METKFANTENSKTSEPQSVLSLLQRLDLTISNKHVAF